MTLADTFFQALLTGFGLNILVFAFAIFFFVLLFIVTRQSLASSFLLAVVALDGLDRVANEPYVSLLYLSLKILLGSVIALVFILTVFKK